MDNIIDLLKTNIRTFCLLATTFSQLRVVGNESLPCLLPENRMVSCVARTITGDGREAVLFCVRQTVTIWSDIINMMPTTVATKDFLVSQGNLFAAACDNFSKMYHDDAVVVVGVKGVLSDWHTLLAKVASTTPIGSFSSTSLVEKNTF